MITSIKKILKNKRVRVVVFVLLIVLTYFNFAKVVYERKDEFLVSNYSTRYEDLKALYYSSQYVKKKNPVIITDDALESFAGGLFLKGTNPILIIHDQPPLGRYIIALSILLFNNASLIIIPLLLISSVGIYYISYKVIGNFIAAFIPLMIFMNEPLLLNKLVYAPLLEPIQLTFIVLSFAFFIKAISSKKYLLWFAMTSIMLGGVISSRFFILGATILASMILFFLFKREFGKRFIIFLLTLPLSIAVLVLSYTATILNGYSVIDVFRIQKYILTYHESKFINLFSFWDLILFNRWHTWWGTRSISSDAQWLIVWPISMILYLFYATLALLRKIKIHDADIVIVIWVFIYCCMLSSGIVSTRYFLPLLPLLYIIATKTILVLLKLEKDEK